MDLEEDYSGYDDYIELDRQWSTNANDHLNNISASNDQFQDILFQKSNFYYVMDLTRTEKYVKDLIVDLENDWGVSESFAIKLLSKFAWNKEKANTHLTEDGAFDLMDVHLHKDQKEFDCGICYSTEPIEEACSYECGHLFCRDCFKNYCKLAIEEGQPLKQCPASKCNEILTPKVAEKYLKSEHELFTKYKKFFLKLAIETSYNLLWCPAPNCFNVIYLLRTDKDEKNLKNIRCECGHCFCFQCKDVAHRPLPCEKFRKWMSLVGGKDETLNIGWIKKNAKQCPTCKMSIEKNQGCMHMTCRNCKHEFCWLCLGDWKQHGAQSGGYFDCNKYKSSDKPMDADEREYEKFNFYRDRFEQHWNAVEIARKKKDTILKNFKDVNNMVLEMKDDSFLREALDLIIEKEVRRAITMTYGVGYFSHLSELEKDMYEMQQSMLWEALDNLDKFTDDLQNSEIMFATLIDEIQTRKHKNYLAGKFNDYKANLNGRVAAVTAACNKLLKYIEGGVLLIFMSFLKAIELQENESARTQTKTTSKDFKTKKSKNSKDGEDDYWYCAFCTYANEKSKKKCDICSNNKKVLKNPKF